MSPLFHITSSSKAFSLIELVISILIIAIISSIAIPAYQSMMIANKISIVTSALQASFILARSEAIKGSQKVSICRSLSVSQQNPTCSLESSIKGKNSGWADGWLVFIDHNGDGKYQTSAVPADILIAVQEKFAKNPKDISIIPSNNRKSLTFGITGQVFGAQGNFSIHRPLMDVNEEHDRTLCMAAGGRVRVAKNSCA